MASNALATRGTTEIDAGEAAHPLVKLRSQLEMRAAEFKMALPQHISPEKFQRTVLTAVQANPAILKADRASLITSCMKAAQDGLLPDGREAALVPFQTRQKINGEWMTVQLIQYMPMVYGLRKKILQSGEVKDIFAQVVYRQEIEAGLFIYEEGSERTLRHKPLLAVDFEPTDDDIVAAYSVATFADGAMSFEVMRRSEINKVRQTSQTGAVGRTDRNGKAIEPKGPWVDWFSEMAKKTVMRRHSKTLPMSGDLIDVEGNEIEAATSATHVLGSVDAEAPKQIVTPPSRQIGSDDDVDHDPVTGELAGETQPSETDTPQDTGQAAEGPSQTTAEPSEAAVSQQGEGTGEDAGGDDQPTTGDDVDPVKIEAARKLIFRFKNCDLVADLEKAWGEGANDYNALPEGLQQQVAGAYSERKALLTKPKGGK